MEARHTSAAGIGPRVDVVFALKSGTKLAALTALTVCALALPSPGHADCTLSDGTVIIANLSAFAQRTTNVIGGGKLQVAAGDAGERVYCALEEKRRLQDGLTADEQELFDTVLELVHNANELLGSGSTSSSLQLDTEGLLAALNWVSHEESNTQGRMGTDTLGGQLANVVGRIAALRGGARGFSVAGLSTPQGTEDWPAYQEAFARLNQSRGGAAGDDDLGGLVSRWGGFVNGALGYGDKKPTNLEPAFDFNTYSVTAGLDYRINNQVAVGAALGYTAFAVDFDGAQSVVDGKIDTAGYTGSVFATYGVDEFYVDGILSYGSSAYDQERRISYPSNNPDVPGANELALSDTSDTQTLLSVGAGYQASPGAWTVGPYLRMTYLNIAIDGYAETNAGEFNLQIGDQDIESLTGALGLFVSRAFSTSFGVFLPQLTAEWINEFANESRIVRAKYAADPTNNFINLPTDEPDTNFASVSAGLVGVFPGGVQGFVRYDTLLALENISSSLVSAGIKVEF